MEALIIPIALIVLAIAAFRFGHDSRPGIETRDTRMVDTETLSVLPDATVQTWPARQRPLIEAPLG